jgi:hypothetical protein
MEVGREHVPTFPAGSTAAHMAALCPAAENATARRCGSPHHRPGQAPRLRVRIPDHGVLLLARTGERIV